MDILELKIGIDNSIYSDSLLSFILLILFVFLINTSFKIYLLYLLLHNNIEI